MSYRTPYQDQYDTAQYGQPGPQYNPYVHGDYQPYVQGSGQGYDYRGYRDEVAPPNSRYDGPEASQPSLVANEPAIGSQLAVEEIGHDYDSTAAMRPKQERSV